MLCVIGPVVCETAAEEAVSVAVEADASVRRGLKPKTNPSNNATLVRVAAIIPKRDGIRSNTLCSTTGGTNGRDVGTGIVTAGIVTAGMATDCKGSPVLLATTGSEVAVTAISGDVVVRIAALRLAIGG